jgi:hypothetical protein
MALDSADVLSETTEAGAIEHITAGMRVSRNT